MDNQPGAARGGARPVGYWVAEGGNQSHDGDEREDEHTQTFRFIAPVNPQKNDADDPGAEGAGFEEAVDGAAAFDKALFDDRDELEHCSQGERTESYAEEAHAALEHGHDDFEEAERIESSGHTKPEKTGFAHGVVSNSVYVGSSHRLFPAETDSGWICSITPAALRDVQRYTLQK